MLLIIGIFASIHFSVNIISFSEYPLANDLQQCPPIYPQPLMLKGGSSSQSANALFAHPPIIAQPITPPSPTTQPGMYPYPYYYNCNERLAREREQAKASDLEKALSFTLIGLLVFSIHFYYARRLS